MDIGKWNYEKHLYEPYNPPITPLILYSRDMDLPVPCAECGKFTAYGDTYTSLEVHNSVGLGYPVCEQCYGDEMKRREEHD